jgi:arylsulfatase A-like enzyme
MNRLSIYLLTVFFILLFGSCSESQERYNVLMIIVDDMNDYGFYDTMPVIKTPALDKFKESAVTFERAYCGAPACVPSRAAVFSGMYPHSTGSYKNGSDPWNQEPFTKIENMIETFKRNGYTTFGRGKILHSQPAKERVNAMYDNEYWGGGFKPFADSNHALLGGFWGIQSFPDEEFPDNINAEATMEFLSQKHEHPFFAVYGLWRPHTPFTAPQRFYDMYEKEDIPTPPPGWLKADLDDVPAKGKVLASVWGERYELCGEANPELWNDFLHAYAACYTFADWNVGRALDALEQNGLTENTIVVFWSDNGYHCGEKNHWEKTTMWEQSALTPFAIRVPGMSNGKSSSRTVTTVDIFPTLAELCGLSLPATHRLDGRSLVPLLNDPETEWNYPAITEFDEGMISIRNERYRYILYPDGTEELYDHSKDPFEHHNISGVEEYTEIKRELKKFVPQEFVKSLGGREG